MTDADKGTGHYEVGYKKPPKKTRFQKGHKGHPRGKARAGNQAGASMTEAVSKKVHTRDPKGKRRSATLLEVIDSSVAMKAAKGDLKAAALVHRRLDRERDNAVSSSPREGSLPRVDEQPRKNYSQIMFEFSAAMWDETYQMLLDENRRYVTDLKNPLILRDSEKA